MYIQIVKIREMLKNLELFLMNTEYIRKSTPGLSIIKRKVREIRKEIDKIEELYGNEVRTSAKDTSGRDKKNKG